MPVAHCPDWVGHERLRTGHADVARHPSSARQQHRIPAKVMHEFDQTPVPEGSERRSSTRVETSVPATFKIEGHANQTCLIRDYSDGGLYISRTEAADAGIEPRKGERVNVVFADPATRRSYALTAHVVRVSSDGLGLQFDQPSLESLAALRRDHEASQVTRELHQPPPQPTYHDVDPTTASFSRLALQLERDLQPRGRGCCVLLTAADHDLLGKEAATELAWSLAEDLGHRVLLVDATFEAAQMRSPVGGAIDHRAGLVNLLAADATEAADVQRHAQPSGHERIEFLPCGHEDPRRPTPARESAVLRFLDAAASAYDFVVVLGSIQALRNRSLAFGAKVDGVLLVALENQTDFAAIERGHQLLDDCGADRVGLVLATPSERPVDIGKFLKPIRRWLKR